MARAAWVFHLYAFYTPTPHLSTPFLRPPTYAWPINFSRKCDGMDVLWIAGVGLLWGVMVLLVKGFQRLEKPKGGRA